MKSLQFRAHIEKRRVHRGHRWFCVTRMHAGYGVVTDRYAQYGPFRSKQEAKLTKALAKKEEKCR